MGLYPNLKRVVVILWLLLLTGCWSSNEIEDLSVYVGIALDKGRETAEEQQLREQGATDESMDRVTATLQIISSKSSSSGDQSAKANQKPFMNTAGTGDSVFEIFREFASRRDLPVIGHHMKIVVISGGLARANRLDDLLDFFYRDNDIRPSCYVVVSRGEARKTLETKVPGSIPAFRLVGMMDNRNRTLEVIPAVSLSKLQGYLQSGTSFILQNVLSAQGEIKFSGAAVIKGKTKKLIGYLNEGELKGIVWLKGSGKGGLVKAYDRDSGRAMAYEIKSMKSTIKSRADGEKLSFDVNIESEGRLIELWNHANLFNRPSTKQLEAIFEQKVRLLIDQAIKKMQQQYRVDAADFGSHVRIEHPRLWQSVKKDWDSVFSQSPIHYKVQLKITEFGSLIN
ncbi:Ger(x)C family spore germination protein [Paenibacillus oenotherae]|uniref:Ger(X)C family spore germination protein n=1 Tax=Paenibacillus oenotherae TaxID=1435645 RepID=A0ABS7DAU9_9BACL|nr:Ger(x)C family spore germination protein [Paenibacillus oenotherae]MBW7477067.1 Ger(x)C family spore germination protein [Paenibacillus oenotherae]